MSISCHIIFECPEFNIQFKKINLARYGKHYQIYFIPVLLYMIKRKIIVPVAVTSIVLLQACDQKNPISRKSKVR
jgi:hypothetical protein